MANFLSTARLAVIATLQAHANLKTYVRRWYLYGANDHLPLDVAKADCPAFEMGPAQNQPRPGTNVGDDFHYRLQFRLHVAGFDVADAEEFLARTTTALAAGEATRFGLAASNGMYLGEAGEVTIARKFEEAGSPEEAILRAVGWTASFPYVLRFRRDPTELNP